MIRTSAVVYEICYQTRKIDKRRAVATQNPATVLGDIVFHAAPGAGVSEWG